MKLLTTHQRQLEYVLEEYGQTAQAMVERNERAPLPKGTQSQDKHMKTFNTWAWMWILINAWRRVSEGTALSGHDHRLARLGG